MPATVVIGAQWGDEGKGKVVDLLAERSEVVARYQGGNNAGHTIVAGDEVYKLHLVPSGILYPGTLCVIGNGTVVDPGALCAEIDGLEERGVSLETLRISGNAHLIMPYHVMLDGASEMKLGKFSIGTTRRGIGPCYQDKAARVGIRAQDLLDPKILVRKLEIALEAKNEILEKLYGLPRLAPADVAEDLLAHAERLRPFIADTALIIDRALRDGKRVLFEGAQGTMLDIDHGTYPFVTSSNPVAGAACTGTGIGPTRIDSVLGVTKAYVTRVGEGPFPTELDDDAGRHMLEQGNEFGTTTGRQRRCGWLDLVALRYAVRLSGMTQLALTKLDVLSGLDRVRLCVAYRDRDGARLTDFPYHQTVFHGCTPEYEEMAGWDEDLSGCRSLEDLPPRAREYVDAIAAAVEVPITLIGTGQGRHQVIDQVEV
ncbi:adenylosuccinate synthase [Miltoncostaea oceani]|jgi:adenylosuccinate synthase|uniref:adenylosuccinate synthase n=1 Tax=Miltoncostaea oceani TaxID=2843216 RepID=UPI001C3C776F|nr:adenylosuccinate synthase [Miltoncostaea oceani]